MEKRSLLHANGETLLQPLTCNFSANATVNTKTLVVFHIFANKPITR